jgi:hypothetical protein
MALIISRITHQGWAGAVGADKLRGATSVGYPLLSHAPSDTFSIQIAAPSATAPVRRPSASAACFPAGPAARRRALPPLPKRRPPNRSEWSPRESAGREPPRSARWQRHAFGRSFVREGSAAFNPGTPIGDLITPPAHHQEGAADRRGVRGTRFAAFNSFFISTADYSHHLSAVALALVAAPLIGFGLTAASRRAA